MWTFLIGVLIGILIGLKFHPYIKMFSQRLRLCAKTLRKELKALIKDC